MQNDLWLEGRLGQPLVLPSLGVGGQRGLASWGFLPEPPCQSLSLSYCFSVATRIEQRKKMNCKSFRWYLDNVYPELT